MTHRLYYDDSYLREFDAEVTGVRRAENRLLVALNRSAFYPTSGGQPFDTGTLNGKRVTDVLVDRDGEVWHAVEGDFKPGMAVHGAIDWARRFDHMQQHAADHMLAGTLYKKTGATTIGLHLGETVSTIDLALKDGSTSLTEEVLRETEQLVNERVWQDLPIRCWFPGDAELAALPLRKKPTVSEHVRIVAMGDFEMVACGGTHPSATGQIGPVKIVGTAPARGKLRLAFIAGARAFRDYRENYDIVWKTANLLTTNPDRLFQNVSAMADRLHSAERQLTEMRAQQLEGTAAELLAQAELLAGGIRLVCRTLPADAAELKTLALQLIRTGGVLALLGGAGEESVPLVFGSSAGRGPGMGELLRDAARAFGGKGGGRPDFAQGAGKPEILQAAAEQLRAALSTN